jgi:UDPglucose--hexose-1-phosphate uridylyltransferase
VLVVPGRASRPGASGRTTRVGDAEHCPFCEGHEAMTPPETAAFGRPAGAPPDSPGWIVRVVPNKYPALPGHEVVVHGPRHVTSLGDLPPAVTETVMEAWRSRRAALLGGGAGYVLASVNEGAAAGASLDHSHSQLVPFHVLPPRIVQEAAAFRAGCPLCPLPGAIVHEQEGLVAFCPTFARVPFETWIAPKHHRSHAPMDAATGRALTATVTRLRVALGADLAWNALLHEGTPGDETFHWHIELWPRLTVAASIELGAGIWVNVVDPAVAARELVAAGLPHSAESGGSDDAGSSGTSSPLAGSPPSAPSSTSAACGSVIRAIADT